MTKPKAVPLDHLRGKKKPVVRSIEMFVDDEVSEAIREAPAELAGRTALVEGKGAGRDAPRQWARPGSSSRESEHRRGSRIVLDRMEVWQGTRRNPVRLSQVKEWVVQAARSFDAKVVFDPWQATGMMQRLKDRGVAAEEFLFSSASVGRLASTLHLLLRDRALALPDDPEFLDELANVRLRETSPGVLRMDHDPDKHDDRAITLAMAAHDLPSNAPSDEPQQIIAVDRRLTSGGRGRR